MRRAARHGGVGHVIFPQPEDGAFADVDEFAKSKEWEELGEGTAVCHLPDQATHLDLSLLAI